MSKLYSFLLSKSKYIISGIVIAVFLCITGMLYFRDFVQANGWILGDWLINYQDGGFKRRGLSGSLVFAIQDITGIGLQVLVFSFQLLLYVTFFYFFLRMITKGVVSLLFLTLLLSPLTFLFYFSDFGIIGRKDIITLTLFMIFVYKTSNKKMTGQANAFFCILIFIATLLHEVIFFFLPYFILYDYFIHRQKDIKRYLCYFMSSLIPMGLFYFFKAGFNEGATIALLAERGVRLPANGILYWPAEQNAVSFYKGNTRGVLGYIVSFLIGIVHFFSYIRRYHSRAIADLAKLFAITFFFTVPLFYLAVDWGRWLHMHFILLLIIIISILPVNTESPFSNKAMLQPIKYFYGCLLIVFLMLLWSVNQDTTGFSTDDSILFRLIRFVSKFT